MLTERQGPNPAMVHVWALYSLLFQFALWIWGAVIIALFVAATNPVFALSLLLVSILIGASTSYAWAFLYHHFYHWQFGDEQMHVWRGVLFRRRLTIPYMRVQNATVVRGPLLMLFGLSSVVVDTAAAGPISYGFLYGIAAHSGGYLPGLQNGEQVADTIIEAAKRAKVREGL